MERKKWTRKSRNKMFIACLSISFLLCGRCAASIWRYGNKIQFRFFSPARVKSKVHHSNRTERENLLNWPSHNGRCRRDLSISRPRKQKAKLASWTAFGFGWITIGFAGAPELCNWKENKNEVRKNTRNSICFFSTLLRCLGARRFVPFMHVRIAI